MSDDHTVVRSGLKLVLDAQPDLEVVAEILAGGGTRSTSESTEAAEAATAEELGEDVPELREDVADVAEPSRTQESVGQGMQHDVGVAVAKKPAIVRDGHSSQDQG